MIMKILTELRRLDEQSENFSKEIENGSHRAEE